MSGTDALKRENEALRERISTLSAAMLRISGSLDLDTALHEIVDSARALTGARYGAITTIDEAGRPRDFVTSGFSDEEHRGLLEWPDGPRLFEHIRDLSGALRHADMSAFVRSLGLSSELMPAKPFQGTPMRCRGVHVGNFYLLEKDGGEEFSHEDEEVLLLFASQAATAIANARTYRDEQRARADLEALVETSPVGVVVFDAATGRMVSLNREAKRIVGRLRQPGRSLEELLGLVTCRRGDGREIALDQLPLAQALDNAETVHAEEIVLSVPGGPSVTTLVNATPIYSRDGAVESVIVTMQDMAPLREIEWMRSEFLGMVSHELRAPLTSIKGSTATVLGASPALDPAEMREFFRIIDEQASHMRGLIGDLLDAGRIDTGTLSVTPEPSEVAGLVDQARSTFLTGGGRHTIVIDLAPDLPRVMADRRRIVQVLNNLFANSARHSPGSSPIRVAAVRDGVHVTVSVSDEGRGVSPERLPYLFQKYTGFGGGPGGGGRGRGLGGSGLGLAICKGLVEAHGGRIGVASAGEGQGTRITFTIPIAEEAGGGTTPSRPRSPRDDAATPVLVVGDDPQTLRYVRDALTAAGYTPLVTADHRELSHIMRTEKPRLVLLDLVLPGTDGFEVMERVPELADVPVILISGYRREETVARALESGADDYIVKPFSPMELTARVGAALRRRTGAKPFALGDLAIDYEHRLVTVAGRAVELTATEYELLRVLSLNAGKVSTYDALRRQVWGGRDTDGSNPVRTVVKRLRRKLGDDPKEPTWIFSERGVGYRMGRSGAR